MQLALQPTRHESELIRGGRYLVYDPGAKFEWLILTVDESGYLSSPYASVELKAVPQDSQGFHMVYLLPYDYTLPNYVKPKHKLDHDYEP